MWFPIRWQWATLPNFSAEMIHFRVIFPSKYLLKVCDFSWMNPWIKSLECMFLKLICRSILNWPPSSLRFKNESVFCFGKSAATKIFKTWSKRVTFRWSQAELFVQCWGSCWLLFSNSILLLFLFHLFCLFSRFGSCLRWGLFLDDLFSFPRGEDSKHISIFSYSAPSDVDVLRS